MSTTGWMLYAPGESWIEALLDGLWELEVLTEPAGRWQVGFFVHSQEQPWEVERRLQTVSERHGIPLLACYVETSDFGYVLALLRGQPLARYAGCCTKPLAIWDHGAYSCFVEANTGDVRRLSQAVTALTTAAARGMSRAFDVHRVGVLGLAVTRGEVTPSEAAAELDLPASSITRHTQALEDAGQVTVVRNPHDARSCLIRPTAPGVAELRAIEEAGLEVFRGVVSDWTAEEVRTMAALTERLTAAWAAHGRAQQARVRRTRPVSRWQHDPLPTDGEEPA